MKNHEFPNKAIKFVEEELVDTTVKNLIKNGPKIMLYLIPANFLDIKTTYPIDKIDENKVRPICGLTYPDKSQGYIISVGDSSGGKHGCCTELNEKGIIEAADTNLLSNNKLFSSSKFKEKISTSINEYLDILIDDLKVETPIFLLLALDGVGGYKLDETDKIMHKENLAYSSLINNRSDVDNILKGLFDRIIRDFKDVH